MAVAGHRKPNRAAPAREPVRDDYDPDLSMLPYSRREIRVARLQAPSPFLIGGTVWYRRDLHGDVTEAIVIDAEDDAHDTDEDESGVVFHLPPWPTLLLETIYGEVKTREARCRGSAGWLPDGWWLT